MVYDEDFAARHTISLFELLVSRCRDVLAAVTFIVVSRPGATYEVPPEARVLRLEQIDMPVSSSEIRRLLKNGSITAPVPPLVATYIQQHELYR